MARPSNLLTTKCYTKEKTVINLNESLSIDPNPVVSNLKRDFKRQKGYTGIKVDKNDNIFKIKDCGEFNKFKSTDILQRGRKISDIEEDEAANDDDDDVDPYAEFSIFQLEYEELLKSPEEENMPFMLATIYEEEEPTDDDDDTEWESTQRCFTPRIAVASCEDVDTQEGRNSGDVVHGVFDTRYMASPFSPLIKKEQDSFKHVTEVSQRKANT